MENKPKIDKEFIENLIQIIEDQNTEQALEITQVLHAADLAEIYNALTIDQAKFLYLLLDQEKAGDVLIELDEHARERFLDSLPSDVIARQFIHEMDSDDAADVIGDLSEEKQEEILALISNKEQAGDIVDLLNYDEDSAGGLMAKEFVKVEEGWDIEHCIQEIRTQAEVVVELYFVYVVNQYNKLIGLISLKDLLLNNPKKPIDSFINRDVISVKTDESAEDVARIMDKYDLVAIPVVDSIGRLVGRITIDDVVDVMREAAEKDYQLISGITSDVESSDRVWTITRARLPWLVIGLFGGILGARVIEIYEFDLGIYPQLAFFIPLIAAMAGNVGIQSSSIIVQNIAANVFEVESTLKKLMKELSVGLMNGIICAALLFGYNWLTASSMDLTIAVSISLLAVILFASFFGTLIPILLNKAKIDPALATGPFITTMNDIVGLLIYLNIGRMIFNLHL